MKRKKKKLGSLKPIDPAKLEKITYYSLMNIPYANFFYARNCLKYLSDTAQGIHSILTNTKIEEMKDKDLEELNGLLSSMVMTSDHIEHYLKYKSLGEDNGPANHQHQ